MESVPTPAAGARAEAPTAPLSLFEGELELDALERMLLAFAVHPHGAGATRAWLLAWDARTGLMEGARETEAAAVPDTLERELVRARQAPPPAREPDVRAWAESPEDLEGVLAEAWRGSTLAFAESPLRSGPWAGAAPVAAIALRRGAQGHGLLVATWGAEGATAAPARFETLRGLANAALGAQARSAEARQRAKQAQALAESARTQVSAVNVAEALHRLARAAVQGTRSRGAAVWRIAPDAAPQCEIAYGPPAQREPVARAFAPLVAEVIASGAPRTGVRGEEAPAMPADVAGEVSVWAALPLAAYGRVHGAVVVWDGADRPAHAPAVDDAEMEFLGALADQAGLLLEHARVGTALREAERARTDLVQHAQGLERMAAVGDLAARVARESRNPIASIAAFARRAQRELAEGDPQSEYLEIVVREAERLDAMLREQLQYAQLGVGRLRMQSLNAVVQDALRAASESLVRRRVRLLRKLGADLPQLLLDEQRLKRVIENILAYALEAVPVGGRIQVTSRKAAGHVAVEIAHDGSRSAGDLLEHLFVPFSTGAQGGAAVGLGVAQQIVREHGGEIRVRSEGEWGAVFVFTLPIAGNEDRRRASDRRAVRGDRRRRGEGGAGAV